ncbi:MAG: DNA-binding protein [Chitinophagaceae bacterium]|jgi:predicted site-specific integrase-resolvase|nr:MAG: DNA-binding protein [Chitinophagaceae bacterium]
MKNPRRVKNNAQSNEEYLSRLYYDNADLMKMFKITYVTIWRWRKGNHIKYSKIRTKYYYPREAVEQMLRIRNE